ncbi:MAG: hypothetical protein ACXAC2_01185 [Candidatus Kariarchaeaceae archaeon]|jgi:hypothetical protein
MLDFELENIAIHPDAERALKEYFQQIKIILEQNRIPEIKQIKIYADIKDHIQDFIESNDIDEISFTNALQIQEHLGSPSDFADYADDSAPEINIILNQKKREENVERNSCKACGTLNDLKSIFCLSCGNRLIPVKDTLVKRYIPQQPASSWLDKQKLSLGIFGLTYFWTLFYAFIFLLLPSNPATVLGSVTIFLFIGSYISIAIWSTTSTFFMFSKINANANNFKLYGFVMTCWGLYNGIIAVSIILLGPAFGAALTGFAFGAVIIYSIIFVMYPFPVLVLYLLTKNKFQKNLNLLMQSTPQVKFVQILLQFILFLVLIGFLYFALFTSVTDITVVLLISLSLLSVIIGFIYILYGVKRLN